MTKTYYCSPRTFVGGVVFALALVCGACSQSDDAYRQQSLSTQELELSLPVGQARSLLLPSGSWELVSPSTGQAISAVCSGAQLRVEARQYGYVGLELRNTTTGDKLLYRLQVIGEHPRLPLEDFAPGDVASSGKTLASSREEVGRFTFEEAQRLTLSYGGKTYRTPTAGELQSLFPYEGEGLVYDRALRTSYTEQLATLGGTTKYYGERYYSSGHGVAYALRFGKARREGLHVGDHVPYATDNKELMAYRYEYAPIEGKAGQYALTIRARYLGEAFVGGLEYIANEGFWHTCLQDEVSLVFPAVGTLVHLGQVVAPREMSEYWSSELSSASGCAWIAGFGTSGASLSIHGDIGFERAIRPILVSR